VSSTAAIKIKYKSAEELQHHTPRVVVNATIKHSYLERLRNAVCDLHSINSDVENFSQMDLSSPVRIHWGNSCSPFASIGREFDYSISLQVQASQLPKMYLTVEARSYYEEENSGRAATQRLGL